MLSRYKITAGKGESVRGSNFEESPDPKASLITVSVASCKSWWKDWRCSTTPHSSTVYMEHNSQNNAYLSPPEGRGGLTALNVTANYSDTKPSCVSLNQLTHQKQTRPTTLKSITTIIHLSPLSSTSLHHHQSHHRPHPHCLSYLS